MSMCLDTIPGYILRYISQTGGRDYAYWRLVGEESGTQVVRRAAAACATR